MSLQKILEDWSEYDDKSKKHHDAKFFACTEDWEVEYLIDKIKKQFPLKTRDDIRAAITVCCKKMSPPHPREAFVKCVTDRLGIA